MNISVIIPTYNEAKYIKRCLKSLRLQTFKPKEIIIVDDGSTDNTHEILCELSIIYSQLSILRQQHKGAGAARNLGAKNATGDILVFVDADMEFAPQFLENLVAPILTHQTTGTFSKDEYVKNWHNPWARAWNYNFHLSSQRAIPENFPPTSPVFRAILKKEFDRVRGFDESRGYDDDWSLSEKLKYQAVVAPNAIYFHLNPDSLPEVFSQARWRARRPYKLGQFGAVLTLIKILPDTLISPLIQTIRYRFLPSFIFKIVYNLGSITGLITYILFGQTTK